MLGKVGVQLLEGHSDKELRQLHGLFNRLSWRTNEPQALLLTTPL